MSIEAVTSYLKNFTGIDIDTLTILNNFKSDGFYHVSVSFFGKVFNFELNPQGNVIQKMFYTDTDGAKNSSFELASINLAEREKKLREQSTSAQTPQEREKYNIYNFFKSILSTYSDGLDTVTPDTENTEPVLTPRMQIFVQRNLIEKDFAIVKDFLPISIKNVKAEIVNQEYEISLSNILTKIKSSNRDYQLIVNSDYIFQTDVNAFENMRLQVSTTEGRKLYNGAEIAIIPKVINTRDLEEKFNKIGLLLEVLEKHVSSSSTNIQLDLETNSVIIDGISYTN